MRRTSQTSLIALATASAFALFATPAFAQATGDTDTPAADATQAAAEPTGGVGEIVVTATRRSENLQDIPLSVATIGDETLAAINTGGADIRGLSGRVPSLNIESSYGRTFPRFYIRGLGNTDFDLNASQPVSLVYDDVVLENPILKGFPAFDVDRIEVLRGPQGTLFGRNTPAGIVKFDSVKPGQGRNYARISWGSYNTINAEGAVGYQSSDEFAVRLSGLWQHRSDWIDNLDEPGDNDLEGYNDRALRGQIMWKPAEDLTLRLSGQYRNMDGNARIFRANLFATGSNDLVGIDENGDAGGKFHRDEVRADGINFQHLKTWNAAGTIEYDLGPATIYSVTSYWNGELTSRGDIDGGFGCNVGPFCPGGGPGTIPFSAHTQDNVPSLDQFTQELRIASNNSTGLGYQAGIFYFDEDLDIESFDFTGPQSTTVWAIATQRQESKALGIFGSVNYKFENGLTVQAGARYNHDKRKMVAARPLDTRPFFPGFPVDPVEEKVSASVLTWDLSAIYELNQDVNVFARVAKGYRAPSLQGRLLFGSEISVADPEKTMSYEAGLKSILLDRLLRLNVTAYYFDTKDLQLTAVGGASNFTTLLNADHVKGHGVEAELEARPATGLTLTAGVSYNYTKIDSPGLGVAICGAPCTVTDPIIAPGIASIDGNSLPQAPKWTLNWTAGYEHPVGPGSVYVFTDWYYRSKVDFFLYKSVEFSDDHLLEGGLRIGYKTDRYDIAAFARNINNDKSAVSGIDFNNLTGMVNEPRIFGIEAGIKF
ncbi:TonB-dependent receptor [Sphingomonas sp. RB56-2]|uniref:TonB-dependent receptor n=1 Tax=Sphingomonas brevis TaxID=2908206 RepID=A0ABT0SCH6_9SPHN|nr:TonB-dependent receptor [Sphingomonas brevis]MCL6742077.1 TonB-dependent receptor [Sphingomonas brevis]